MIVTTLFLILFLTTAGADECGDRCTSSQVCGEDDGICYDKSELITCRSFTSIFSYHYCKKDQACCSDGCMPAGSVCCYNSYCASNHTCCSFVGCCPSGTFCSGFRCISDIFSTQKPTTATPQPTPPIRTTSRPRTTSKPRTTIKPRTTLKPTQFWTTSKPITRYPTKRPNSYTKTTSSASTSTIQIASIVGSVIFVLVVGVVIACLIRRSQHNKSNVQSPTGRNAMVVNAPAQMYGQVSINSGASYSVPVQTNRLPQQPHVAYIATKPVITKPMAQYPTKAKDKKMQLFSL